MAESRINTDDMNRTDFTLPKISGSQLMMDQTGRSQGLTPIQSGGKSNLPILLSYNLKWIALSPTMQKAMSMHGGLSSRRGTLQHN